MSNDWCTIESDPGVFTCLIESFGVKGAELSELWSLDENSLMQLGKVYGLIFLFKWEKEHISSSSGDRGGNINRVPLAVDDIPPDFFFARQMVTNACATQALLSVLLNAVDNKSSDLTLGPVLREFKSFTSSFPPDLKGEAIGGSEEIRVSHNSFSKNNPFLVDETKGPHAENGDVFHFIAYVPQNGKVYELDGLQPGPIVVGNYENVMSKSNCDSGAERSSRFVLTASPDMDSLAWLPVARAAIQERIECYAASEIKFNLMAVVRDKRLVLEQRRKQLMLEAGMTDGEPSVQDLKSQLRQENEKRSLWERENQRRRHNYLPLCVELLKALAGSGKLQIITEEARDRFFSKKRKTEGQGK